MNHQEKGTCCETCLGEHSGPASFFGNASSYCRNPACSCHSQKAEKECLYGGKCTHGQCLAPTTDTAEKGPVTNACMMPDTYSFKEVPSNNTTEKTLIINSNEYTDIVLEGFTKAVDNVFISTTNTSDVEALSAQLHDIYMKEARRQGDVRHQDAYADLPEHVKEFDRVLARFIITLLEQAREAGRKE